MPLIRSFRCFAIIIATAFVSPAAVTAQDAFLTCVQNELTALGYPGITASAKYTSAAIAAVESVRAKQGGKRSIALIPKLSEKTAASWCREIAAANPALRRFMPAAQPPRVLSKDGQGSGSAAMLAQAFQEAERYFQSTYGLYPASRVDVAGADSGKDLVRLAVELQRLNGPSYGRMDSNVSRVCGNPARYFGGQAYREQLLICWPRTGSQDAAWRRKTQPEVTEIMVHEYMHHIQRELSNSKIGGRGTNSARRVMGPAWMTEGTAEYVEYKWSTTRGGKKKLSLGELQAAARQSQKPLMSMQTGSNVRGRKVYHITRFAAYLLASRFGDRAIFDYWRYIGQGRTWEQAFQSAFGMRISTFQTDFQVYRVDLARAAAFAAGK